MRTGLAGHEQLYIYIWLRVTNIVAAPYGAAPYRIAPTKGYGPLPSKGVWATGCPRVWATCLTDVVRERVHI